MGARWLRNPSLMLGALISIAIVLCAIFAPAIATHGVEQMDMRNRFAGPGLQHWLGTDNFGRDLWSRLVFGARISLGIALLSVSACSPEAEVSRPPAKLAPPLAQKVEDKRLAAFG